MMFKECAENAFLLEVVMGEEMRNLYLLLVMEVQILSIYGNWILGVTAIHAIVNNAFSNKTNRKYPAYFKLMGKH